MLTMTNYLQKAHRISQYRVADTIQTIEPGQYFQLNDDKEWEYADGTKKAYPTLNVRLPAHGKAYQNELLQGRDDVTQSGMITCLAGNFVLGTTMYDLDETYEVGQALVVTTGGILKPFDSAKDEVHLIAGHVLEVPEIGVESALVYEA